MHEWLAQATDLAEGIDQGDWPLIVETRKTGKYGRWIARVRNCAGDYLNDDLDAHGHNKTPGYGPDKWT